LNKEIASYPPFDGKEKHFLKAQITRITHATTLTPRGLYKQDENNAKEI